MKKHQITISSPEPMNVQQTEQGFTVTYGNTQPEQISFSMQSEGGEAPKPSFKKWRAESGGQYFFINEDGTPQMAIDDYEDWDNYRHLTDNYFQELAKCEHRKYVKEAIGRVIHAIIEANEGWEPDWEDSNQSKYIIHYDHYNSKLDALHGFENRIPVILPFCKTTNIAISIISSHKEDLDLIFNLKK